jgi:hypothetical protein
MTRDKQREFDKWLYRQNARNKMTFGVHESALPNSLSIHGGESYLRYMSIPARKEQIKDTITCIQLMRSERFKAFLQERREAAFKFYME